MARKKRDDEDAGKKHDAQTTAPTGCSRSS